MNRGLIISFFCLLSFIGNTQLKTLIPKDQEVDLPLETNGRVGITTSFVETSIDKTLLKKYFIEEAYRNRDSTRFHIVDTIGDAIEFFMLYPCKTFDIENIQKHQIISEGLITSTVIVSFLNEEYEIKAKDFEWIDKKRKKTNLDNLYYDYNTSIDLKFKVKNYGILKSAEQSIIESMEFFTIIIQEIINKKTQP